MATPSSPDIAIILPAYNEALTIENTIKDFYTHCPQATIYVINNNSKDNTANIAQNTFDSCQIKGRVLTETRQGKGNAVRLAFHEIQADVYVMADADMTYPAAQVNELIQPIIENKADMVVGNRHASGRYQRENKRLFHNAGNGLVKNLVNFLFGANLKDIMSGYRAFNKRFVQNYQILVEGFQIETDMTLHALDKRFRIVEIPIEYKNRPLMSFSKLNTFSDGIKVILTVFNIFRHYRPLQFFSTIALFICLLGITAGVPVFMDWFRYRYIYHVPLAILAAALESVAIMFFGIGLILDSITHHYRLRFEKTLQDSSKHH